MRYETAPTPRGNIGVSYVSQEKADAQAAAMDAFYCTGCTDCTDCAGCTGCTRCTGCTDCTGCTGCTYFINGAAPTTTPAQAVANLDTVREIILDDTNRLYMGHWHGGEGWETRTCAEEAFCGTTHCLAGWLQVCALDSEVKKLSAALAGAIQAPVASHMFYKSNEEVLAWLREREYAKDAA